jgi:multidrug resistance efflux pump
MIINPHVSSQITAVFFHDGDYVKKDQLLFAVDDKIH